MSKWFKMWAAILLSFLFAYGTPIAAAFYLFAEEINEQGIGGFLFFAIMGVVIIFLVARLNHILSKMRMGATKIVIKMTIAFVVLFGLYQFLLYVDTNTELLAQQLIAAVGGILVSFPFKLWALHIDRDYIERIGVFG